MIILGKFGDKFAENFHEEMKKYRDNVSYHPFQYQIFSNDELLPRFCNEPYMAITKGGEIRFPPGAEKLRGAIKNDPNVLLVVRGASGYKWKPVHELFNGYLSSKYLKTEMEVKNLILVLPSMPFDKQDRLFYDDENGGELIDGAPITLKYARELLREYADILISFNPHDYRDRTGWIIKDETTIPGSTRDEKGRILDSKGRIILPQAEDWTGFAYAIDAMPTLAKYVLDSLSNPFLIGPDRAVENAIKKFSNKTIAADKVRDRHDSLNAKSKIELWHDMKDYDAVLFDDKIQAGTTMNNVVQELKVHKSPPRSITCAAVNGEFVQNKKLGKSAFDILKESGAEIIVTNTIETPVSKVSVVTLLAEELYKLIN